MASDTVMMRTKTAIQYLTATLILLSWSGLTVAESRTVSAVIPWQGQGETTSTGTDKLRFQGTIEGIMYIGTVEGPLNEAFVQCQIVQDIDVATENTSATGDCTIVTLAEDSVIAKISCRGTHGYCIGEFELTGGTGRYSGIGGSSKMIARSPIYALAQNLSGETESQVMVGILQLPELKITSP